MILNCLQIWASKILQRFSVGEPVVYFGSLQVEQLALGTALQYFEIPILQNKTTDTIIGKPRLKLTFSIPNDVSPSGEQHAARSKLYSYFQVNRPRRGTEKAVAPSTDVVQINENCFKRTSLGITVWYKVI
ncbi:hypothetical protein [Nostoc sp.]|uniref:hypothetical protein n=1 Tax=Nostoc sp. TaxID=1180 RepID=UPI002FF6F8A7